MEPTPLIVIGASAGGVGALLSLARGLQEPLAAPVLVVLHIGAQRSDFPALWNAAGVMPAKHGRDGEKICSGQVYVAPPDRHMLVVDGHIRLTRGPKENWARPAIDPLFRSAAEAYGPNVIGVILTGRLNDGTAGLYEIKRRGGVAVVQDPEDAANPEMPRSAARHIDVDYCVSLDEMPALLSRLVAERIRAEPVVLVQRSPEKGREMIDAKTLDRPLTVTCPDCGGALRRGELGGLIKYDCHIGHTYTAETLAEVQFEQMERVMRAAERILNERAEFCRQMAERSEDGRSPGGVALWRAASKEAEDRAYRMRDFVEQDWIKPELDDGAGAASEQAKLQ
ncbi:MAG TPA: chemotaxis protein CheB [Caulobacteraceae bacterium]